MSHPISLLSPPDQSYRPDQSMNSDNVPCVMRSPKAPACPRCADGPLEMCPALYPTVHARDPVALLVASPPAFWPMIRHIDSRNRYNRCHYELEYIGVFLL